MSVIITCYNLERFIGPAIESLLKQDCEFDFEIIVVDDASSDSSREVISSFDDKRVIPVFLEQNAGAANAINIAFSKATGEYICRFDGDDVWYPQYLRKAAAVLDTYPDVKLVHTDVSFINENSEITSRQKNIERPSFLKETDHEFKSILQKYYMNAPAIMARRSDWDRILPWAERFRTGLGDWYNSLLMVENDLSYFIDEPLAYYRIHTTNMHRAMIKDRTGEKNTLWVLDFFKGRNANISSKEWDTIYFTHSKYLAFAYFSHGMEEDARRCFKRAFTYKWSALANPDFVRIWLACIIGKKYYNKAKTALSLGKK